MLLFLVLAARLSVALVSHWDIFLAEPLTFVHVGKGVCRHAKGSSQLGVSTTICLSRLLLPRRGKERKHVVSNGECFV